MKIVVLEDNHIEYIKIENALDEWGQYFDINLDIAHYTSGEQFFNNVYNYDSSTDLFILDIEIGIMNGIDVAKKLRLLDYHGDIIFLTAFKDFVFEGYNVHAFNYLVKPLNKPLFFRCLNEIERKHNLKSYVFRDKQKLIVSIPYQDIISFSVSRHYVYISTISNTYEQYVNLNALLCTLPNIFIQVHRSCIVNLMHIQKISHNKVFLSNGSFSEIGRTYQKQLKSNYLQYMTRFNRNGA